MIITRAPVPSHHLGTAAVESRNEGALSTGFNLARSAVKQQPRIASLLLPLRPARGRPLYRQIYEALRQAIRAGVLPPGTRIPSTRTLATELQVSRSTVVEAVERLGAEGYLSPRRGSATVVAERPETAAVLRRPPRRGSTASVTAALPQRTRQVLATKPGAHRLAAPPRAFRIGTPAVDLFPLSLWAKLSAQQYRRATAALLDYGSPAGYAPLRSAIASHVNAARGVRCGEHQVIIGGGVGHLLDLAMGTLTAPGDRVWVENPGYAGPRVAAYTAGATVVPVPVDTEGLDVGYGLAAAEDARMACVCPSHQIPFSVTMSTPRRQALIAWAHRAGAWIIEDDYDSEYRYEAGPLPALQSLDPDGRVLYLGTFSTTLFPALRLAFLVVPEALVDVLGYAQRVSYRYPPAIEQAVLAEFIAAGHFANHLRRMRIVYRERRAALLEAAQAHCSGALTISGIAGGLHVFADLHGYDDATVAVEAARRGIEVGPLSAYYATASDPQRSGLVLGFGTCDIRSIELAMPRLADALAASDRRARTGT